MPRPYKAREISKRCFHSENACVKSFPSTQRLRNLKTQHFVLVSEENTESEITWLLLFYRFRKASFSKRFPPTLKKEASLERVFEKPISEDDRPNHTNKAAFLDYSGEGRRFFKLWKASWLLIVLILQLIWRIFWLKGHTFHISDFFPKQSNNK